MPAIRIDEEVMERLKHLAVEHGLVFGTPNEVLRTVLRLDSKKSNLPNEVKEVITVTNNRPKRPTSEVRDLKELLDALMQRVKGLMGGKLEFNQDNSYRWIPWNGNYMTIKVQEARNRDIAITVFGVPEDFDQIERPFEIKMDRPPSYSRFNISKQEQVNAAVRVIFRAYELWNARQRKKRGKFTGE